MQSISKKLSEKLPQPGEVFETKSGEYEVCLLNNYASLLLFVN